MNDLTARFGWQVAGCACARLAGFRGNDFLLISRCIALHCRAVEKENEGVHTERRYLWCSCDALQGAVAGLMISVLTSGLEQPGRKKMWSPGYRCACKQEGGECRTRPYL